MNDQFPSPAKLKFSDIKIGSQYSFQRKLSNRDILTFAKLIGDFNPLHINPQYSQNNFTQNIVHGMLAASCFSTLVGMYCPGENCLYLSQEIEFIKPIYPNQKIQIKGTIIKKVESLKILNIKTEIIIDKKIVVSGEAKVKVLE